LTPAANTYNPNYVLTEASRFNGVGLGKGNRIDFAGKKENEPAPCDYKIPGAFDKFDNIRKKCKVDIEPKKQTKKKVVPKKVKKVKKEVIDG
jgi:hypothetical protein